MKKFVYILLIVFISFSVTATFAQNKPDEELTKDEAVLRIADFQARINELKNQLMSYDQDVEKLKKDLEQTKIALKNCNDTYNSLIGASDADLNNFRQQLGQIEGKVREMQRLSDDILADKTDEIKNLERQLNALRAQKIAALPEFYDRIISLARDIKGLYREKKIKSYTVGTWAENRDCLWNIASKMEIYSDPFQWPKIWQSNKDMIKNPDIIFPGQVFKIPPPGPKTTDEAKAERKYWRNKRVALDKDNTGKKGE